MSDTLLHIFTTVLLISGYDYVGFNLSKHDETALAAYRVTQVAAIGAGAYRLKYKYDYGAAGKSILLQWTFAADLGYYGIAALVNPSAKSGFENRADAKRFFTADYPIPWAEWTLMSPWGENWRTPVGLVGQSLIGVSVTVAF